jgi:type VI secretion system secreted protein VgrG
MNSPLEATHVRMSLAVDGLEDGALVPTETSVVERLSSCFEARIDAVSADVLDLRAMLGATAALTFHHADGDRKVLGIVASARTTGLTRHRHRYELRVVPPMWLLSCKEDCRIFQDLSVVDIVVQVLEDAGVTDVDVRVTDHEPRNYCTQYRESDLAFVERLLAEEGICYFFDHTGDTVVTVLSDDPIQHDPHPTFDVARYDSAGMAGGGDPVVRRLELAHTIRTGSVSLRDYAFKAPDTDLTVSADHERDAELEAYRYPGRYVEGSIGDSLAQHRLEALQVDRERVTGESDLRGLCPGYRTTFEHAPRPELDCDHLILAVTHHATQAPADDPEWGADNDGYHNTFEALRADIPFRPPTHRKPRIEGLQSAVVTGPSGEEIHVDEYGRIKAQFHWDRDGARDETSSCWIRVARTWAGAEWGQVFHPRIGQEVIVQFLEGDPDRPVVTGMLYNETHMPPYALPGAATQSGIKSRSTPNGTGSNEIRFEDAKGSEELYLHAQKDHTLAVENDSNSTIGNNSTRSVGADSSRSVGNDDTLTVDNNRTVTITNDHTETVTSGNRSTTVSAGNHELTVSSGTSTTTVMGDTNTTVQTGNWGLEVSAGEATINAKTGITATTMLSASVQALVDASINAGVNVAIVAAAAAELAAMNVVVAGSSSLSESAPKFSMDGDKITITADTSIILKVGGTTITIKDGGLTVKTSGDITHDAKGKITSKAKGVHTLKGSKINAN